MARILKHELVQSSTSATTVMDEKARERAYMVTVIGAIMREAELQAEMTCAFLNTHGIKLKRRRCTDQSTPSLASAPEFPRAAGFLREFATSFRIWMLHQDGMGHLLPIHFPTWREAYDVAINSDVNPKALARSRQIARRVLEIVLFQPSSAAKLEGTDICLPATVDGDQLLDQLADFLYRHCHYPDEQEPSHVSEN